MEKKSLRAPSPVYFQGISTLLCLAQPLRSKSSEENLTLSSRWGLTPPLLRPPPGKQGGCLRDQRQGQCSQFSTSQ